MLLRITDLLDYLTGAADSPLVQAAVVHAQFETIHSFSDGNGRVGRALMHTSLARRGLTTTAVLPISLVPASRRGDYITGLNRFRYEGPRDAPAAQEALREWVEIFVEAADDAVTQSRQILADIQEVRSDWEARIANHRETQGRTRALRSDSATARVVEMLRPHRRIP